MRSDPTLRRWYKRINKKFFDGVLPDDVCVRWSNEEDDEARFEEKYFGVADHAKDERHRYEIVMSRTKNIEWCTRLTTLAHEMCHIATELKDDHGPAFDFWVQYITSRGIFKKSALRKGLTLF